MATQTVQNEPGLTETNTIKPHDFQKGNKTVYAIYFFQYSRSAWNQKNLPGKRRNGQRKQKTGKEKSKKTVTLNERKPV